MIIKHILLNTVIVMNKLRLMLCLCIAGLTMYAQPTAQESTFIKVDQFGYLPDASKVADLRVANDGYF